MLAELSQLVAPVPVVLVTGLASPGKMRLVSALQRRLEPSHIPVRSAGGPAFPADVVVLHVHAETDFEALIEGGLPAGNRSSGAQVIVPVDWEPVDRSVTRVVESLASHGLGAQQVAL